jgi:hypothetical protein
VLEKIKKYVKLESAKQTRKPTNKETNVRSVKMEANSYTSNTVHRTLENVSKSNLSSKPTYIKFKRRKHVSL